MEKRLEDETITSTLSNPDVAEGVLSALSEIEEEDGYCPPSSSD